MEAVILDIEGTICPIAFVKETLFPYFLKKAPKVLKNLSYPLKSDTADKYTNVLCQFPLESIVSYDKLISHIENLVKNDIKDHVLKSFQGLIWQHGYDQGELTAPIYDDAIEFIMALKRKSKKIYIYSSGSIKAQLLLFKHVKRGDEVLDMTDYLSGYFDLVTIGNKYEGSSYSKILKEINYENKAKDVLFLTDNIHEADAAISAGMQSKIVYRLGNPALDEESKKFDVIYSLDELKI
ncbi:uncharacterized protein PRCAT00001353001 [Priceomyces carsonii]|uniref:uncharacterized protein n=1 Tax=Priceomyces carsonii TaxID=28549 RepID=UPI002ED8E926|nr:unnamed protein product [Priceomyces carsonii]